MILYDAVDIKAGSDQVIEIRAGNELLWAAFENLWMFDIPTPGTEIQLKPTITGSVQINWGDDEIDTLTNNISINHTYLMELPPLGWSQLGSDIDGEAIYDQSGYSVSINAEGNRITIGSWSNDANGLSSGHVRIYEWRQYTSNDENLYHYTSRVQDNTQTKPLIITPNFTIPVVNDYYWVQLGLDIDGEAGSDYSGWSVSMNDAGNRVAIGAFLNDGNGSNSGHTRIYEYNGTNWTQLGQDIDGEAAYDNSGSSVSMNATGDRVAIGALGNNDNGSLSGHTRIYEYNVSTQAWDQLGQDIDGELAGDQSGSSVSMNATGDRVAIGAILNDGNGVSSGHTRIYEYNVSTQAWDQLGNDIDGEAQNDRSGHSVSMNATGDRVAIGARYNDGVNGIDSGHTRIYKYNVSTQDWEQLGQNIDGELASDQSGYSVSINAAGDRVAIGAPFNDGNGNSSGHTRIYEYNGANWVQLSEDIDGEAADDRSGHSVSINADGDHVAIGAIFNDGGSGLNGHTRIYKLG